MPIGPAGNALDPTPQFGQAEMARQGGWDTKQVGLDNTYSQNILSQRTLPDITAQQGAQGNLYSGGADVAASRATNDAQHLQDQNTFGLRHIMSDLSSQYLHQFLNVSA